jgi:hypothetical protein
MTSYNDSTPAHSPKLPEARIAAQASIKAAADQHAANVIPVINEIRRAGAQTLRDIAEALITKSR